jgi:hypothetical protein
VKYEPWIMRRATTLWEVTQSTQSALAHGSTQLYPERAMLAAIPSYNREFREIREFSEIGKNNH